MEKNYFNRDRTKPEVTTILIGIFLITLLFITYNIFLNTKPAVGGIETSAPESSLVDKIKEIFAPKTEKVGVIDDLAAQDSRDEIVAGTQSDRSVWIATDYVQGDIKNGQYIVKRGDTLWEIAEAVYGNGSQWHRILDANKDNVGFLPNGSQALIVTGQILIIP